MAWKYEDYLKQTETCPICGKAFVPAVEHMWKIGGWGNLGERRYTVVCSYTCMRKWEKEQEASDKAKKKRHRREYASRF